MSSGDALRIMPIGRPLRMTTTNALFDMINHNQPDKDPTRYPGSSHFLMDFEWFFEWFIKKKNEGGQNFEWFKTKKNEGDQNFEWFKKKNEGGQNFEWVTQKK